MRASVTDRGREAVRLICAKEAIAIDGAKGPTSWAITKCREAYARTASRQTNVRARRYAPVSRRAPRRRLMTRADTGLDIATAQSHPARRAPAGCSARDEPSLPFRASTTERPKPQPEQGSPVVTFERQSSGRREPVGIVSPVRSDVSWRLRRSASVAKAAMATPPRSARLKPGEIGLGVVRRRLRQREGEWLRWRRPLWRGSSRRPPSLSAPRLPSP